MPRNKYHDTPVVEFHEAFAAPVAWSPGIPSAERRKLRCALIIEEALEFCEASGFAVVIQYDALSQVREVILIENRKPPDLVKAADGLADLRYVTDGASLEWGIPLEKCLREVHRSNMSKLDEQGQSVLREDGKILKGPHFMPPQIAEILELYKGVDNG